MSALPVIIGSVDDPHVNAVCSALKFARTSARVINVVDGQLHQGWRPGSPDLPGARGWIRRLAPPDWGNGAQPESRASAVASAKLAQLSSILYSSEVHWLTGFAELLRAENKMIQLESARQAGAPIPDTLVTSDLEDLRCWRGGELVAKPLAIASFVGDDGIRKHVPASVIVVEDLIRAEVAEAPFIYQELVRSVSHFRVVTVMGQAWVAELDAHNCDGIDWRLTDSAHDAFLNVTEREARLAGLAVALAGQLSLGFSSQDWIRDETGRTYFLDMNPSGQWMFLPDAITRAVAQAIATFLMGN